MYQGRYRLAARHLKRSLPRSFQRQMPWFFSAVCEYAFVPIDHAKAGLKKRWGRLTDAQRKKALDQLRKLIANDPKLLADVFAFLGSAFNLRHGLHGEALLMELKRRKAERKMVRIGPLLRRSIDELSPEERRRLSKRIR